MTVKEAVKIFNKSENEIRNIIKQGLLNAQKEKGKYIINGNTKIILSKNEIKSFLMQILKFKNNNNYDLQYGLILNNERLNILYQYLLEYNFISKIDNFIDEKDFFYKVHLTEAAFNFILGAKFNALINNFNLNLNFCIIKID